MMKSVNGLASNSIPIAISGPLRAPPLSKEEERKIQLSFFPFLSLLSRCIRACSLTRPYLDLSGIVTGHDGAQYRRRCSMSPRQDQEWEGHTRMTKTKGRRNTILMVPAAIEQESNNECHDSPWENKGSIIRLIFKEVHARSRRQIDAGFREQGAFLRDQNAHNFARHKKIAQMAMSKKPSTISIF